MSVPAAVLREMGRPAPYAESRPLTVDRLELDGPGRGEVLVDLAYAGLCHSDLSVIDASRPRGMPLVLGHEASGVVAEIGPDVHGLAVGDHVSCTFVPSCGRCGPCATGRPALCEAGARANTEGTLLTGARRWRHPELAGVHHHLGVSAFASRAVVAQESLVRIDPDIPLHVAAVFGCAVLTGVGAALNAAAISPGTAVAVFGLGGVGLSTLLGARVAGAYPIVAVDVVPAKLAVARELGADHVVDASASDAVEQVRALTGGGADRAIECAGNAEVLASAYTATRRGGVTVTVGLPHPGRMLSIPAVSLTTEERTLRGSYLGSAIPARDIPRYLDLYRAGRLPVDRLLSRTIDLGSINEGFDELAAGSAIRVLVDLTLV